MSLRAIYVNRQGASVNRSVSAADAVNILERGRYGARQSRVEDEHGEVLGERFKNDGLYTDLRKDAWVWWFDRAELEHAE